MAALALDAGILYMRQLLQDSNTNFPGATDAEYTRTVNDRYMMWYKLIERRVQAVTAVTSISTSNVLNTSDAGFIYPEIEAVYVDYQSGPDSPLERFNWNDLVAIVEVDQAANAGPSAGVPSMYAARRLHGSSEKWQFLLWPLNSITAVLKADVRVMPTALSGTAVPELGDAEGYWLYRIAASDMAPIVGRPELAEAILAPVPDFIRGKMGVERKRDDPKRRPETSVLG